MRREGLHTLCEGAGCPNIFECWEDPEATFLIGGDQCTRRCDFCQIDTGKPADLDRDEPRRVTESVQTMGLRYGTTTGVARADLPDGGSWRYATTVRAIKELNPSTGVELLIPDFNADPARLAEVFESRPEVLAHNVETVPRIFKRIRPAFGYQRSLGVLSAARDFGLVTKSNLILGFGETPDEVRTALADLRNAGCDIVTITQYLRPSTRHHPVERWVKTEEFVESARHAKELGYSGVLAGRLVRSSDRRDGSLTGPTQPHLRCRRRRNKPNERTLGNAVTRGMGIDVDNEFIYRSAQFVMFAIVVAVVCDLPTVKAAGGSWRDARKVSALHHRPAVSPLWLQPCSWSTPGAISRRRRS